MNKTFDIRKTKQKRGRVTPAILPRASGKTTAILDSMEKGDLCISPFFGIKNIVKSKCSRWIDYEIQNLVDTGNGIVVISKNLFYNKLFWGRIYKTVYVDDFLYYNDRDIEIFINTIGEFADNAIMISSNHGSRRGLPRILQNKNIYYDGIGHINTINLPNELFEL